MGISDAGGRLKLTVSAPGVLPAAMTASRRLTPSPPSLAASAVMLVTSPLRRSLVFVTVTVAASLRRAIPISTAPTRTGSDIDLRRLIGRDVGISVVWITRRCLQDEISYFDGITSVNITAKPLRGNT